jgi:glutamate racemase
MWFRNQGLNMKSDATSRPIGVFDSGFGGLTILKEIVGRLPDYDFMFLGDNARTPYGNRSFEAVYEYTKQSVFWLFDKGCPLVVLACNTASAKALRSIQQKDLPVLAPNRRVLGVIRPVTEQIGAFTRSRHVGIFATVGTVRSQSYAIEINKMFPDIVVTMEACPLWVPLVENNETGNAGTEYFVRQHIEVLLSKDPKIDTIILGCTHYPLLMPVIKKFLPPEIALINQGIIEADSLAGYLKRHPEIDAACTKEAQRTFYTTDCCENFDRLAEQFYGIPTCSQKITL